MIIATAGHVDHGKTSLVKRLTGVDTDRLEEEKRRGLSIDLGFAYHDAGGGMGQALGFIDVPGHQRFINTMISGVSGIDLGMLVVAADDGIMPQTREHVEIMHLMGIRDFVAVVSKIDRVEGARISEVHEAVHHLLAEYISKTAPVFPVSNENGEGLQDLQAFLRERQANHERQPASGNFRLNIDRVFNLKGIGLMVTGTVLSGEIHEGENVRLLPDEKPVRVRSLHAQNQPATSAGKGVRCALNITGDVTKQDVAKGDWLVGLEAGPATRCFTAAVRLMSASVRIRHSMPLKLYIGARHVTAKLGLLPDSKVPDSCAEEDVTLVQIMPEEAVCCSRGDRFLLRDYSENFLLGGGQVLDPLAAKTRNMSKEQQTYLNALALESFASAVGYLLIEQEAVTDFTAFRQAWNLPKAEAVAILEKAGLLEKLVFQESGQQHFALSVKRWQAMLASVFNAVKSWHVAHPELQGIALEKLQESLDSAIDNRLMLAILSTLQQDNAGKYRLVQLSGLVKQADFQVGMSEEARAQWQQLKQILEKKGPEIPLISEVEKMTGIRGRELNYLISSNVKSGRLIRISSKRVGLPATLKTLADSIASLAAKQALFSVIDFKNHIGTGRNYAIEVLDFMDTVGFTERIGNERRIVDSEIAEKLFT